MARKQIRLAILGSTGSIGKNGVEIALQNKSSIKVDLLLANGSMPDLVLEQCRLMSPKYVFLQSADSINLLSSKFEGKEYQGTKLLPAEALEQTLRENKEKFDVTLAAVSGFGGILPTAVMAERSSRVAIANKEAIICGWWLINSIARESGCTIIPVDSEHNALYQILNAVGKRKESGRQKGGTQAENKDELGQQEIDRLIITASGGPFLNYQGNLSEITPEMAVKHPRWQMGKKNSIDSATMANKGMEIMEACLLFGVPESKVQEVVHPQAIVHAMVSYKDGSTFAFLSNPDMKIHIANAISVTGEMQVKNKATSQIDILENGHLEFMQLDHEKFPLVMLARKAINWGPSSMFAYTLANEIAVEAFLSGRIGFDRIFTIIEKSIVHFSFSQNGVQKLDSMEKIKQLQSEVIEFVNNKIMV